MIKVLVAEDSPTIRAFLTAILESEPDIKVVGAVSDGDAAVQAVQKLRPDVVTMDIHMPGLDGFTATREIMETVPVPIVIVSGAVQDEMAATFKAVEAGALAFVRRPAGLGHDDHEDEADALVTSVRLMSEVKVVRRWKRPPAIAQRVAATQIEPDPLYRPRVVAIGASTGGPVALQTILGELPADFPLPVLVVQHIAYGFVQGFADWLNAGCALPVTVAVDGEEVMPGHVYVAPDDRHMGVDAFGRIRLDNSPAEAGLRPSVGHLFRSVAVQYGRRSIGVLLTGMGSDGAEGLCDLRALGAATIAQDAASSVVHGMPGVAIERGGAGHVLPASAIAGKLVSLAG
ncbi:chemotaxis-specific protein-glutamate methyltransferase CheB [Niveispirillum sp. KHB5.9]|uniref:chemotaxis-specific protein-glutamate methyltransferase CheB n=1 Tax=Niveispirillum sp. KHB5.9 TaxID=3400269 RepID=UPI003A84ABAB